MPEQIYRIENLDCANCAAKAEEKIRKLPGVEHASITFATMQLRLTAQDPDALLPQALAAARTVEPDIRFLPHHGHTEHKHEACHCGHDHHHDHDECHCGHDHHHEHDECHCGHDHHHNHGECHCGHDHHHEHDECHCGHDHHHGECHCGHEHKKHAPGISRELGEIILGGALFITGIVLQRLLPSVPVSLVAFIVAYLVLGWEVLLTAGKNLIRGRVLDENFLMSLATVGAFAIGDFPEAVGVMLFYRVGEYFEHRAMDRSRAQIMDAVDLRPESVNLMRDGSTVSIPAEDARPGDLLLVRPGDRIPLDAVVVSGESRIDTAPITGEPVPVSVKPGDSVVSGCVNTTAQLILRAEKPLSESMVSRILRSVESAAASKPKIDRFITRFARVYTPVVVTAAVLTAVIPSLIWGNWNYWVYTALSFLVMSCPCALVLSVPLAFFCGIGAGSKRGILFKSGLSIEALAQVRAVVMDKTGTITKGTFEVQEADPQLLALCAACEQNSTHPIAQSITAAAKARGLALQQPEQLEEIPGHGIRAVVNGEEILCGNEKLLTRFGVDVQSAPSSGMGTQVLVARGGSYLGSLTVSDALKPGAKEAVDRLKQQGITPAILTGDQHSSAEAVATLVGIQTVHAQLLPEEKLEKLQSIRSEHGAAMFVGDGINDAPVLAGADVGAAMGSGADAAIEAADVVFMTSLVSAVPEAVDIARATRRIALQNVVFALAVKGAVMVLGLLGMASMWAAVFADSGVAMLCVLNAIRMLYRKKA